MKCLSFIGLGIWLAANVVAFTLSAPVDGFAQAIVREQGGNKLTVKSGGTLDVESGGAFKIANTSVTSSAAELNIVDGVTSTAAELNYLDIASLGTGAASKACVLNASGDYTFPATATIVMPSSGTFTFQSGSTLATAAGALENGGVAVPTIRTATDAVANGQTSKAVTVTGITTSSKCLASLNEVATNSVTVRAVVPTSNTATVHLSGDPGATGADLSVACFGE